jgi:hypothetical protein
VLAPAWVIKWSSDGEKLRAVHVPEARSPCSFTVVPLFWLAFLSPDFWIGIDEYRISTSNALSDVYQ